MSDWIIFFVSATIIVIAGKRLADYGDDIARVTNLGRVFIGSVLLAASTSLPEVAASATAAYSGADNLAMGNVFGSNTFNMIIIVVAQLFATKPILANVQSTHITVAATGILLSALATMGAVVKHPFSLLGVGLDAWLIIAVYLLILRLMPATRSDQVVETRKPPLPVDKKVGLVWSQFAAAAAVVVVAGWFLSGAADAIAVATGLGQTFVGGTLLAACTSLPEVVVSIACVKRAAYDLALGNVLGSNIFNMAIIWVSDLAKPGGVPILSQATDGQLVTALLGLILSGIVVLGLSVPKRPSQRPFQWDSGALAVSYFVGTYLIFALR